MNSLDAIFSPQSIAVLGASQTPGKVGHDIFANILRGGYTETLYPVNRTANSIMCVKAYPTIEDIFDEVDLAIVILPRSPPLSPWKQPSERESKASLLFRPVPGGRWGGS